MPRMTNFDERISAKSVADIIKNFVIIKKGVLTIQKVSFFVDIFINSFLFFKLKNLISKEKLFFLTEGPHLFYCNIRNKKIIDDIPFSKDMTVETFDLRKFYIFTLKVKYKL